MTIPILKHTTVSTSGFVPELPGHRPDRTQ